VTATFDPPPVFEFGQDGNYSFGTGQESVVIASVFPARCLDGVTSCEEQSFDEVVCSGDIEQSCTCVVSIDNEAEAGTFSVDAGTLRLVPDDDTPYELSFCVAGDTNILSDESLTLRGAR
jgi:hypothetical protein